MNKHPASQTGFERHKTLGIAWVTPFTSLLTHLKEQLKKKTFLNSRTLDRIVVMFQLLLSDPAFMHSFASLSTMMVYYASPDFSGSIKIPMWGPFCVYVECTGLAASFWLAPVDCLGGSSITFTISAQVFKFSISDFRPQLQPNQMSLALVQWKNKWTGVSLASLHSTHVELVIPNRCSRLSLVYSSSKPILHNSIFTLSWIMSFQRGWQFTGLAALVAWSWFPLYADFIEKRPLGSFIHINLSWVGLIGIEILLMASMDSIQ